MKINTTEETASMLKKDYWLGFFAGILIGIMFMPVLKMANLNLYLKFKLIILPFFILFIYANI